MARGTAAFPQRPKGEVKHLKALMPYLRPYRWHIVGAAVSLIFTSSAMLGMGGGLRYLVDEGIGKRNTHLLDQAFWILMGVTLLLAVATYSRFYLVSYVGEKFVADIRREVYRNLISMHIGFFEVTSIGELLSRLTADTALLQVIIGSSVSIAARNLLLLIGGYVGAYLGTGFRVDDKTTSGGIGTIERTYTSKWAVTVFTPAAWVETKMRDVLVHTVYVSPEYQQRLRKLRVSSLPNSSAPAPNPPKP